MTKEQNQSLILITQNGHHLKIKQPGEGNLYDGIINNISDEEEYEQVQ